MQEEAADELVGVETHHLGLVAIGVVVPSEAHMLAVEVDEAVVADGGLVGVAAQVRQNLLGAGERGLGVDHPVVRSQRGLQALELGTVVDAVAARQAKLAAATVKGAHASTLDWRALLRRYMTDAARRDYSWSLPNRRFIDSGLYLPSIRSEGIDAIAVIVDTSGSLPAKTLAEFWSELREVATELQPGRVIVLQVDSALQDAAEYTADDLPDEIALRGRGGTDFRPGFAWLDEQGIRPGVCLYFTDMECSSYPETEPDFGIVWVNYASPPSDWNREPWGERIDIAAA